MTELEILALTDDQIDNLVKVEKMEEGIKLLECPVEPEYEEEPTKDTVFYGISGLTYVCFDNMQAAQDLAESMAKHLKAAYYKDYSTIPRNQKGIDSYHKDHFTPKVTSHSYFSPEVAEAGNAINNRNDTLRERYDSEKSEYNKYADEVKYIVDELWGKVNATREKYRKLRNLRDKYSEYKQLAENEKSAATFFLKAFSVTDEEFQLIKKGDLGDQKAAKK